MKRESCQTASYPSLCPQDKNPSPLNQLDFLMDETYASIMETGSILDATQEQLAAAGTKLACTVQLIVQLIRCGAEEGVAHQVRGGRGGGGYISRFLPSAPFFWRFFLPIMSFS